MTKSTLSLLEFPSSLLLAVSFLLIVFALHKYAKDTKMVRWLSSPRTGIALLFIGVVMLGIEGTWSTGIHSSIPFVIYVLILMMSVSLAILRHRHATSNSRNFAFTINHLGIFIVLWAALFGNPDSIKAKMIVTKDSPSHVAYTSDGLAVPLPFDVTLLDFEIERYDDGKSPKQYTSTIAVDGQQMQTSVNHPCSYHGYSIYQDSYDTLEGKYTVLQFARDPWLPLVYLGMGMLAIGAVLLLFGKWKARITIPITVVLTILFTAITVARINFGTLMPALRSWWFMPHLFIYMVAYSLMAMALIFRLLSFNKKLKFDAFIVSDNLMRSSSALLVLGMLIGSIWAKEAWGDYWAWDPKENWAAVTWFLSLVYLHLGNRRNWKGLAVIIIAFLALQITWYGINYLPSAVNSLHSYNS